MRALTAFLLATCVASSGTAAAKDRSPLFGWGVGPTGNVAVPIRSVLDLRYDRIVRQQYDFSCGSAALATLLRYHYDFNVREENAFRGMWAKGDQDQIRRLGFSLLDMKRWLASRGLSADGYKVTLDKISATGVPGIALITTKSYRHFVVIKGVSRHEVLIGDPSSGLTIVPRKEFEQAWNGVYFVLADDQQLAKSRFNRESQWASFARAPVGGQFLGPLSNAQLQTTAPFYGDF